MKHHETTELTTKINQMSLQCISGFFCQAALCLWVGIHNNCEALRISAQQSHEVCDLCDRSEFVQVRYLQGIQPRCAKRLETEWQKDEEIEIAWNSILLQSQCQGAKTLMAEFQWFGVHFLSDMLWPGRIPSRCARPDNQTQHIFWERCERQKGALMISIVFLFIFAAILRVCRTRTCPRPYSSTQSSSSVTCRHLLPTCAKSIEDPHTVRAQRASNGGRSSPRLASRVDWAMPRNDKNWSVQCIIASYWNTVNGVNRCK